MPDNKNLLKNPSFIYDTQTWVGLALSGSTPTVATDSSDPLYGTGYSASVTFTTSNPNSGIVTDNAYSVSVNAGEKYTFSAYVKVPSPHLASDFSLRAYFDKSANGAGGTTSLDSLKTTISSYDGWVRLTFTFTVPATYNYFRGFIYRSDTENSAVDGYYKFLVDAVQLETGSKASSLIYDQGQKNKLVDTSLTNVYIDHLKGMKLKADIRLGDFVFNRIDEYGVVWVVDNIEGWWGLPEVTVQDLPRGWGDGSYTTFGRFGARQLTITGSFLLQDTDSQLEAARNRLINAINLVKKDTWLVLDEEIPKGLKVRLSGNPEINTKNPRGRTDFSIGLVAANPIKFKWEDAADDGYALETISSNSSKVIRNEGNTPVGVVFEIIGPTTGPTSLFNKQSEQLIDVIYGLGKYRSYAVSEAEVSDGNLIFTTDSAHGLSVGDSVDVLNCVDVFKVSNVVCSTTNYLTISTELNHNFSENQRIYLTGISGLTGYGAVSNGEYLITSSSPQNKNFTVYASGLSTTASQNAVASSKFSVWSNTSSIVFDGPNNIATVTTQAGHGFSVQDQVVLSSTGVVYNGTDRKSTRLNSSHVSESRMPSSA